MRLATLTLTLLLLAAASLAPAAEPRPVPARPNVVFVLTDDLSWNLVRFMPNVRAMQRDGMTFTNYFVTNSLCCPSRASILTGRYPHNHRVLGNTAPAGGFQAFRGRAERRTFATALHGAGYRTSMMGKYLNGYRPIRHYVAPGWTNWQVMGSGYAGFDYFLSANGRVAHFGRRPRAYATDVLKRRGKAFIAASATAKKPFALEVATFAPHRPSVPAPRDVHDFPGLQVPRGPAFNAMPQHAPAWLRAGRSRLSDAQIASLDSEFRRRAQSVQAVDEMVGQIRRLLRQRHLTRSTYVVFSSDNGYHMGERQMGAGKMTPYDTDIRVPLIVVGPGVKPGTKNAALASNIDLAPTFMRMGGAQPSSVVDGASLLPLLRGKRPGGWRDEVLIEHHHPIPSSDDPDRQTTMMGNPPSYDALRTKTFLYVQYVDGEREFYDLRSDPYELDNVYGELSDYDRSTLEQRLDALKHCRGAGCRRAAAP